MVFVEMIIVIVLIYLLFKWSTAKYHILKERNIPHDKPVPFFGNSGKILFNRESMFLNIIRMTSKFRAKVFGMYNFRDFAIVVKDPELIKQVTIKDFDSFINHPLIVHPEDDILFGNALVNLHDQKWKDMRSTLSPTFTGSKMRIMFDLITECCDEGVQYLKDLIKTQQCESNGIEMDMKDYFTRFTNDVIASAAFGLKVNSFKNQNNEFFATATNISSLTTAKLLKFLIFSLNKKFAKAIGIKISDVKTEKYFINLVKDTMKYRMENNLVRHDMVHLLMEANGIHISEDQTVINNLNKKWSDEEIIAQCFLFFVAGFETTATLLSFCAHELMLNDDVQQKLIEEIDEVKNNLNGKKLSYDNLKSMKYMDMVVSETLRKWPQAVITDRICNKEYTLKDAENTVNINIKPKEHVWIPIVGLHYYEEFFPNPYTFDPERFNDENKNSIKPNTYLPFGIGPRNCIGSRFALMEIKAVLFTILSEFNFLASPKTTMDLANNINAFQMKPKKGFWLKLKPRQ